MLERCVNVDVRIEERIDSGVGAGEEEMRSFGGGGAAVCVLLSK